MKYIIKTCKRRVVFDEEDAMGEMDFSSEKDLSNYLMKLSETAAKEDMRSIGFAAYDESGNLVMRAPDLVKIRESMVREGY